MSERLVPLLPNDNRGGATMDTDKLVPVVDGRPKALSMTEFDDSRYSRDHDGGLHPLRFVCGLGAAYRTFLQQ
jgi:hypothetical protein